MNGINFHSFKTFKLEKNEHIDKGIFKSLQNIGLNVVSTDLKYVIPWLAPYF